MLDVLAERHRVISNNIANVNTPGYRAKDINFKDVLASIQSSNDWSRTREEFENDLEDINVEWIDSNEGFDNQGINDVSVDREMVKLSTNTLLYKTYAHMLIMRLKQINMAVRERT
jgi:flagellar basal-body rod protein FlgB